ncbi:MAG: TetR/AcrR family transcriptional regulator [Oscillospiraceae bacterium]
MNKKQEANAFVKECITTALLELMGRQSFESITVTALIRRAGVGRMSFYRNFGSKEEILRQHLDQLITAWGKEAEKDPSGNFGEVLFRHYYQHKELFSLLYREGLSYLILQNIKDVCGPKEAQSNAEAYASAWLAYGLYGWIDEWFHRGMPETPEEMGELWLESQRAGKTP